ncbi:hypothetical protein AAHA92_32996 [Salvia divinorum]|uniref:Uncharacterized protein n=1 Tax=Salvia divinorum TaxID=28513 RepID=A0ABD1FN15_SALDI
MQAQPQFSRIIPEAPPRGSIKTRLRTGALCPVCYFYFHWIYTVSGRSSDALRFWKRASVRPRSDVMKDNARYKKQCLLLSNTMVQHLLLRLSLLHLRKYDSYPICLHLYAYL